MDRVPTGGDLVVRYVYSVGRIVGHKYGVIVKKRQEECDLYFGDPSLTLFEILIDGVIEHVPKREFRVLDHGEQYGQNIKK
jgi:hypothetical protein